MALTVRFLSGDGEPDPALALTLDAPRVVFGRSRSCEVMLLDATVSARHASVQQQGGKNVIIDEGSTNGILVGTERLPARTPYPLRERETVRIGRIWLELRTGLERPSEPRQAELVAREWLTRRLAEDGEPARPVIRVVEGPDQGASLDLVDPAREYVIGRSKETDLSLPGDGRLSRRHLAVTAVGSSWMVRDLRSKRGSALEGESLDSAGASWSSGARVTLGETVLELDDPLPEALSEALEASDERMHSSEFSEPVPGRTREVESAEDDDELGEAPGLAAAVGHGLDADGAGERAQDGHGDELGLDDADDELASDAGKAARLVETIVVLVALAVLGGSVAGLVWLLGP